jgi:hypothetical protein
MSDEGFGPAHRNGRLQACLMFIGDWKYATVAVPAGIGRVGYPSSDGVWEIGGSSLGVDGVYSKAAIWLSWGY